MSTIQEPPAAGPDAEAPEIQADSTAVELAKMRRDLDKQARSIKGTQNAFTIFAVLALMLAMASLLAVVFKLDRKPKTVAQPAAATAVAPAAATPSTATAPAPVLSRNVDVSLNQFSVTPTQTQAPAGTVTFRVHNAGTITHEFVVIKTNKPAADLPIKNGRAVEAGNVGETGDLAPGKTKTVAIKLPAGHYALICNLPGHYLAGQHTDFTTK